MKTSSPKNSMNTVSQELIKKLPKIELHAHLNGCIRFQTLKDLCLQKGLAFPFEEHAKRDLPACFAIFAMIHQVMTNLESIQRVTREMLEDFCLQNVIYLEIRTTPKSIPEKFDYHEYLKAILAEIIRFDENNPKTMIIRLLFSIDRSRSVEQAEKTLELLEEFKANPLYSDYILGLDYSGNPYKNSFRDFEKIFSNARAKGFKIAIHVAETPGEECKQETREILQFKPDRLGHFNYFDEDLLQLLLKDRIPLEVCPSSNFCTIGLNNLKEHHFGRLFKENYPMSICTDDTGVFDTNLNKEMESIFEAFEIRKEELKLFLNNSLQCILQEEIREYVKKKWIEVFEDF